MWAPRQEPDPENKISRSHYKILSKVTEICWKQLSMTGSYSVQSWCLELHVGPRQESDSGNKTSHSHYKILSKMTEICWK